MIPVQHTQDKAAFREVLSIHALCSYALSGTLLWNNQQELAALAVCPHRIAMLPTKENKQNQLGSSDRVYRGIMRDLEEGRMVPGQRLAETDLATLYGVGRNAVREAMQQLGARGVIDLNRNRSPAIRFLDARETMEVLDVAEALTCLAARASALRYDETLHAHLLQSTMDMFIEADAQDEPGMFSRARRHFYRALLAIGGNRELQRLFPAISMHIIYAQYQTRQLRGIRFVDYRSIIEAITRGDAAAAEQASRDHVRHVRQVIESSFRSSPSSS